MLAATLLIALLGACGGGKTNETGDDTGGFTEDDTGLTPEEGYNTLVPDPESSGCYVSQVPLDADEDGLADSIKVKGSCRLSKVIDTYLPDSNRNIELESGYDAATDSNTPTFADDVVVDSGESLTVTAEASSDHPVLLEVPATSDITSPGFSVVGGRFSLYGSGVLNFYGKNSGTGIEASAGSVTASETVFENLGYGISADAGTSVDLNNDTFRNTAVTSLELYAGSSLTMTDSIVRGGFTDIGDVLQDWAIYTEDCGTLKLYRDKVEGTNTSEGTVRLDGDYVDYEGLVIARNHSYGSNLMVYGAGDSWESSTAQHHVGTSAMLIENTHGTEGSFVAASPYDMELTNMTIIGSYGEGSITPAHEVNLAYLDEEEAEDMVALGMDYGTYGTTSFLQNVVFNNMVSDTVIERAEGGDTVSYNWIYGNGMGQPQNVSNLNDYPNTTEIEPTFRQPAMFVANEDGTTSVFPFAYDITNAEEASSVEAGYNNWYDQKADAAAGFGIFQGEAGNYGLDACYDLCIDLTGDESYCSSERETFLAELGGSAADLYDEFING